MNIKLNKVFNLAMLLPIALGLCSAAFMGYVFWWPPYKVYVIDKAEQHHVLYDNNGYIRTRRYYCINNDQIPVTISRDMIRISGPDVPELRITLPQTVQTYEKGCHAIDRVFEIPKGTPPGNYRLVYTATWQANPFRDDSTKLPELYVAIDPKK